jgi:hypothetical protein
LLATTSVLTHFAPNPTAQSHTAKSESARFAFWTLWNALQFGGWSDSQLSELQRRWEQFNVWQGIPETVEFQCACFLAVAEEELSLLLGSRHGWAALWKDAFHSPSLAWGEFVDDSRRRRYSSLDFPSDESAFLLHCLDLASGLRRAAQCATWSEIQQLAKSSQPLPFAPSKSSGTITWDDMHEFTPAAASEPSGLLGMAAETEALRRIVLTALALERHLLRRGAYPASLEEIDSDLLVSPAIDFMDGKPLRFRLAREGRYVLYSVGLDCTDDGGRQQPQVQIASLRSSTFSHGFSQGFDLVWPRPASQAESEQFNREESRKAVDRMDHVALLRKADPRNQTNWYQVDPGSHFESMPGLMPGFTVPGGESVYRVPGVNQASNALRSRQWIGPSPSQSLTNSR